MSDGRAEALLRSALEKIVYFEARSEALQADAASLRAEADALRADLAAASQREVELRRRVAELEVELGRAHREREEAARVLDAMRAERAGLMGKVLEAARIQGASDGGLDFDLAGFIADLRAEALALRVPAAEVPGPPRQRRDRTGRRDGGRAPRRVGAPGVLGAVVDGRGAPREPLRPTAAPSGPPSSAPRSTANGSASPGSPLRSAPGSLTPPAAPAGPSAASMLAVTREAERLFEQGRLAVPPSPRHGEESLFGFSIRELSSPDPSARCRAAERLRTLGDRAAAPALAVALHAERDDAVLVALLEAFRALATREGAAVVEPLLGAPEAVVRIAALRAITHLDPDAAPAHLSGRPTTRTPRSGAARRCSPSRSARSGCWSSSGRCRAIPIRRFAVWPCSTSGAAGGPQARTGLLGALEDPDLGVRRAAARSLSGILGIDLSHVPTLSDEERRREVRRLTTLAAGPPLAACAAAVPAQPRPHPSRIRTAGGRPPRRTTRPPRGATQAPPRRRAASNPGAPPEPSAPIEVSVPRCPESTERASMPTRPSACRSPPSSGRRCAGARWWTWRRSWA